MSGECVETSFLDDDTISPFFRGVAHCQKLSILAIAHNALICYESGLEEKYGQKKASRITATKVRFLPR